jgi:hypothetical protein
VSKFVSTWMIVRVFQYKFAKRNGCFGWCPVVEEIVALYVNHGTGSNCDDPQGACSA